MARQDRLLRAARRQPVDCTPVWFMRQAGRIFPRYRQLRKRYDFLTLCRQPELSAEVTLLPVEHLGVDAAILFADIMLPLEGLGVAYDIREGGPRIERPVRSEADLARLRRFDPREDLAYVLEAVRLVRRELDGRCPLIGFAGAPFTLACYLIEGRPTREFTKARAMMFRNARLWHGLMELLSDVVL
ncbi:MAG TPA: uroporphyrinogen decarboxylase family protein, partial [Bacillota bacterium]